MLDSILCVYGPVHASSAPFSLNPPAHPDKLMFLCILCHWYFDAPQQHHKHHNTPNISINIFKSTQRKNDHASQRRAIEKGLVRTAPKAPVIARSLLGNGEQNLNKWSGFEKILLCDLLEMVELQQFQSTWCRHVEGALSILTGIR